MKTCEVNKTNEDEVLQRLFSNGKLKQKIKFEILDSVVDMFFF